MGDAIYMWISICQLGKRKEACREMFLNLPDYQIALGNLGSKYDVMVNIIEMDGWSRIMAYRAYVQGLRVQATKT